MSQESHRPKPAGQEAEPGFAVSDGYATELSFVLCAWEDGTLGDEQTETTLRRIAASAGPRPRSGPCGARTRAWCPASR
jgi:hypothetical protein